MRSMKIVLCGPPRSGKSCLRQALKDAIRRSSEIYPYVLSTNPDGEGAWFQETVAANPELATELKRENKRPWSAERAELYATWVRDVAGPLTFVDIGGIPDVFSEQIARPATHLLLLAPNEEKIAPWRAFAERVGVPVIGEIWSDYHGTEDRVDGLGEDGIYRGVVHHLERGHPAHDRPLVRALAKYLVGRLEGGEP